MKLISNSPGNSNWWDKIDSKFSDMGDKEFKNAGFRAVPGSIVRKGSFVDSGCVLMPSFINIGAYVGSGTMGPLSFSARVNCFCQMCRHHSLSLIII